MSTTIDQQRALERYARQHEHHLDFPRGFESATERRPLPRWVNWLAAVLIIGGYAVLEWQDHITEQAIKESRK